MTTPPQEPQEPQQPPEPQGDQPQAPPEPAPQQPVTPMADTSAPMGQYAQPPYAQSGYGQQPQYSAPPQYGYPAGPRPGTEKNWMGITSLVLSLSGLIFGITAIAGIVFGHLGLAAANRGEADNRGVALGGLITGYVLVGLGIITTIIVLVFFGALVGGVLDECLGSDPAAWCTD